MKGQSDPFASCLCACSACSGDYEDPERTASSEAAEGDADDEESAESKPRPIDGERFPAREK